MKINYNHFGNMLTYARISRIEIDNDFVKTATNNEGIKTVTRGRILVDVKLYPSEEAWKQYRRHTHILENLPIEGDDFNFCIDGIAGIESILNAIINERLSKAE